MEHVKSKATILLYLIASSSMAYGGPQEVAITSAISLDTSCRALRGQPEAVAICARRDDLFYSLKTQNICPTRDVGELTFNKCNALAAPLQSSHATQQATSHTETVYTDLDGGRMMTLHTARKCELPIVGADNMRAAKFFTFWGCWYETLGGGFVVITNDGRTHAFQSERALMKTEMAD